MKKITDRERLDWIERQTDGNHWIARQSTTGRGFRLHNTRVLTESIFDRKIMKKTAREAIDAAMRKGENGTDQH